MNVSEFLHSLAISAGIETDNAALKLILADPNLGNITVPTEFDTLVSGKFKDMITLEAAKNHPDLKKHFYATSLYGIDKDIDRLAKDNEFTDEEIASLKKIDKTEKRLEEFSKMTKDKFSKKAPATDEEKHKKLQQQIADLNKTILEKDELGVKEKAELKQNYLNSLRDRTTKELFQKYNYTDAIPQKVQSTTAQTLFFDDIKSKGYKVVFNEENDGLKLLTSEDTEVFINNKSVDVHQYVENLLAENKLLKITPQAQSNGHSKVEPIIVQPNQMGQMKPVNNSAFLQELEIAAQDSARKS